MSRQNKISKGFLLLFPLSLLLVACGVADTDIEIHAEPIADAPTSDPAETPVPTPTIEPTPTLSPEQQDAVDSFDSEALSFHDLYELEFILLENGQIIAQSPFDKKGDPHFTFDAESNKWVDNHPGRSKMDNLLPETTEDGRSILFEFQGFEWDGENNAYLSELNPANVVVWDQDAMAYRYVDTDTDPGHDQFFIPKMSLLKKDEIDHGRSNFSETDKTDDFERGKSGVRLDFYVSDEHEYSKWWSTEPRELCSQLFAEMYLRNFPQLKGKQVIVRVISEDITSRNEILSVGGYEFFFDSTMAHLLDAWATGVSLEVAPHIHFITLSLGKDGFTNDRAWDDGYFYSHSHLGSLWALQVNNAPSKEANMSTPQNSRDMFFPVEEELMDTPGFVLEKYMRFKNKD